MSSPHVVILGGGPAGLGAAYRLARRGLARVTLLEGSSRLGGIAGSFQVAGYPVDYGSHRLHPSCAPEVLKDLRDLLGGDLLLRPRHGRIRLKGRWVHFPLKPVNLATRLPPSFALRIGGDLLRRIWPDAGRRGRAESFATVLEAGLGKTICRQFYFPYAEKIWGMEPGELSAVQARRRVSAGAPAKMVRKLLSSLPGFRSGTTGCFYYPRQGFGQIAEGYGRAARQAGAEIRLDSRVTRVELDGGAVSAVHFQQEGQEQTLAADFVWSTIPIPGLVGLLHPVPPKEWLVATDGLRYRGLLLIYLVLEQDRFSEYDAHYFPEPDIPISRLSEPKNYRGAGDPKGRTVLCAELPCDPLDPEWSQDEEELGRTVLGALKAAGIPVRSPVSEVVARRLSHAYPIYRRGYEAHFDRLDRWLDGIEGLLTFGRQGLFAHDNTHHALRMGYSAVECLDSAGRFDRARWRAYRETFDAHVVED